MRKLISILESSDSGLREGPLVDGRIVPRLHDGSTPTILYRILSKAEFQAGRKTGGLSSLDGRIHADTIPHFEYAEPGDGNVLIAIDYHDDDGWKAKWSGLGCIAITSEPIPMDRIRVVATGDRAALESLAE